MSLDKMNLLGVNSNNKKMIEKILEIKMTDEFRVSKPCIDEMFEKISLLLEILGINNINPILIFNVLTSSFCDYTSNNDNSCVVDKSIEFYNFFYEHLSMYMKDLKALPMYFSKDGTNDDFKYFIDRTLISSSSLFSFDFKDKYDNEVSNEECIYKMFYLLYDYLKNNEFFDEYCNSEHLLNDDFNFTYSYNFLAKQIVEDFYQSAIENDGFVTDAVFSKYSNYIDVSKFSENVKNISDTIDVKNLKKWLEKNITIKNKYKYEGKYEDLNNLLSMMYLKDEKKRIGEPQLYLFLQTVKSSLYYNEWYKYKQIFKVSNELEDDFINNENHILPFVAIKNIPFNCFYIDMTDNETLGQYFNGAFVYVNNLQYENYGKTDKGDDFTLSSFVVDCLLYDKLGRLVNNDYEITFSVDNEEEEYALTKDYLVDKYKGLKLINDNPMIKTVMPYKQLNSFNFIPTRFLRKAEKFLINAIFYLCVDSKKIVKDNDTYKNKEKINNQKSDNTVTDITYTSCGVIYKNKYLDERERETNKECDGKMGTPKAPHLVRGHFHGYWHGSEKLGNKRLEYQYVAPYYTGNGSEIAITVTTIKP